MVEENEATMARIIHGLNREIRDIVGLHHYVDLDEFMHQVIKVEQQLKRKSQIRRNTSSFNSLSWKDKSKLERASSSTKEATIDTKGKTQIHLKVCLLTKMLSVFKCHGQEHITS